MQRSARSPLRTGAVVSACLHLALFAAVLLFVHGTPVQPPPPQHPVILDLSAMTAPQLMNRPQPPPPTEVKPPPKLAPSPPKLPLPITSQAPVKAAPQAPPKPPEKVEKAEPQPRAKPAKPASGAISHQVSDDFHKKLEEAIRSHLRYPPIARRQGREGSATVRVRMQRDGTLISVNLVKSSGTESLDREAQEVFHRIGKLPAMPADFMPNASEFDFQLAINFHLLGFGD